LIRRFATCFVLAATLLSASASAQTYIDARDLFQPTLDAFYRWQKNYSHCPRVLGQSWGAFDGYGVGEYQQREQEFQSGANQAALCAIASGYLIHEWLGELSKIAKAGGAKKGLEAAANRAMLNLDTPEFWKKFFGVMTTAQCTASTPPITITGSFRQIVNITCKTPMGPTTVNLDNLRVTINGRGYWNAGGDYYGRTLKSALGSTK
jgi:hypothetical protein